ncbi:hypothetical protein IZU27_01070 [Treponema socranskii]
MTWSLILSAFPKSASLPIASYHRILSADFPEFINNYIDLPILQRLSGIGLLCGTDWTPLYRNRFFYSRLDHSIGVALILWHFTHDRAETLAGLLHDVSTPVFSHVADFRNGDALTQESTENENEAMLRNDDALCAKLRTDGISIDAVADYHVYPLADNKLPRLSADRLEYMFPSGAALEGSWTLSEIAEAYGNIDICINEDGERELGFRTQKIAETYCEKTCRTGHILQLNENKLALKLLSDIVDRAIAIGLIAEKDCYEKTEREIVDRFDSFSESVQSGNAANDNVHGEAEVRGDLYGGDAVGDNRDAIRDASRNVRTTSGTAREDFRDAACTGSSAFSPQEEFIKRWRTFRTMTRIEHTDDPLPDHFCVSLDVKMRYIDPLVIYGDAQGTGSARRLTSVSKKSAALIEDFLSWRDTKYGCAAYALPLHFAKKTGKRA